MNKKALFNDGWEFAKSSLEVTDSRALASEPVDIPHDWLSSLRSRRLRNEPGGNEEYIRL